MSRQHGPRCVPWDTREASVDSIQGLARMRAAQGLSDPQIIDALWHSEHLRLDRSNRQHQGQVGRAVQLARQWANTLNQVVDSDGYLTDVPSVRTFLSVPLQSEFMYAVTADLWDTSGISEQRISRTLVIYSEVQLSYQALLQRAKDEGQALSQSCSYFGTEDDWLQIDLVPLLFARNR